MIIDQLTMFADAEAASGTVATRLEGDVINLVDTRDIGNGQPIYLVIVVTTAFTSGGAATVNFQLASDAAAAIATDGSATTHVSTGVIPYTDLVKGRQYVFALPLEGRVYEQYLGILVTTAGATTTAGAFSAFLSPDPIAWKPYPEAVS